MARPQAADYDEKQSLIAAKAAELFAEQGASSASLSKIATACKTSKSLIYHYYGSKEELLFDVMDRHMSELIAIIDELGPASSKGVDAFKVFTRALMDHYVGAANSQKVLLYELDNLPAKSRKKIISKEKKLIAYAEDMLKQSLGDTHIDKAETRVRIMLFFGMVNWSHSWFKASGPTNRRQLADLASDITLRGAQRSI